MAKKGFGASIQIGSGKTQGGDATGASDKWARAAANSQAISSKIRAVNVKYVPLAGVMIDPDNPRDLSVSPETVTDLAERFPVDLEKIRSDDAADWLEGYCSRIASESGLTEKALTDFLSIAEFASQLKSGDQLINPVTAWQDDSTINLIAGERRYLAHLLLGEDMIKATLLPERPSDLDLLVIQWQENSQRESLNLHDRLYNLKAIAAAYEKTGATISKKSLAALAGIGLTTAQRYLVVMRCTYSELIDAIKDGRVNNIKKAAELAVLNRKQLLEALGGKRAQQPKETIKFSNAMSHKTAVYIINSVADSLGGDELKAVINETDLTGPKGIKQAFTAITEYLEANHG